MLTKKQQEDICLSKIEDSDDNPAMLQVLTDRAYHEVFVFALAVEKNPNKRAYDSDKILMTIFAGADSAVQSVKASIEVGSQGLRFGLGEKGLSNYTFNGKLTLGAEKGKYSKLNIPLPNGIPNAVGIAHEDVNNNTKYILSDNGHPADVIAQLMGSSYNLHLLDEWKEPIFNELTRLGYIKEHDLYVDRNACPLLQMYSIDLTEEAADAFISDALKNGIIKFPVEGTGTEIEAIEGLGEYMPVFSSTMGAQIARELIPVHNPAIVDSLTCFNTFARPLFPVQGHAATAIAKKLQSKMVKSIILQGEMSTGKSTMMVAAAHGYSEMKKMSGYFSALICPPSLTVKWPKEIKAIIPNAEIHVIKQTEEFIRYHQEWERVGRPRPTKPVFFIFSFTTLRNDCAIRPAVEYVFKRTAHSKEKQTVPYRDGIYCPNCGKPHQTIETVRYVIENDREVEKHTTHNMTKKEFGITRRIGKSSSNPPNSACYYCNSPLWTKKVEQRYKNFADWANRYEKSLLAAIKNKDASRIMDLKMSQPEFPTSNSMPRRVAAAEYIRRKVKGFFDILIVDEIHELKGGTTAQGHALASLVGASKKVIAGTGTLFGGKAEDVYYLLWRLFPQEMVKTGFEFREVTKFNEQFGNIEETIYEPKEESQTYSNKASRGGQRTSRKKVVPGISPFIFANYMLENVINVRLTDVWPDPVELVDTPTIMVDMTEEQQEAYNRMIARFEDEIDRREDGFKLYTQMLDYGIAYPDNPINFPDALFKNMNGERELICTPSQLDSEQTFPKEKKLQEIVQTEIAEGRPAIVYVRDTGSSVSERDIRPRLKAKLEEIGAKVCILDTTTTATNRRSEWLEKKIVEEGYDVCIVSQELVKVGLDLLCTPTLIYYQFSWSLFTIQQSSRRAWRIGQTEECRLYYIAYKNCYQQYMAELIAKKMVATAMINGDVSSDGLSAMLGDEGDLQSMLLQSVKDGTMKLEGVAEDWIAQTSDRARELLENIGKPKAIERRLKQIEQSKEDKLTTDEDIFNFPIDDITEEFDAQEAGEIVEYFKVTEQITKIVTVAEIQKKNAEAQKTTKGRKPKKEKVSEDQLAFDLFAV